MRIGEVICPFILLCCDHFITMKFEDAKTLVLEKLRSQRLTSHGVLDLQRRVKSVDSEGEDAQWDNPIPGGEDADTQYMTIGMLLDVFDAFVKDDGKWYKSASDSMLINTPFQQPVRSTALLC